MQAYRIARVAAWVALAGLVALPAAAQAPRRDSLTLYELPDYRGASVTFYGDNANIGSTGFTERARSAQVIGTWRVCTGGGFRGRCEVLTRNLRDLSAVGLSGQVGSAQRSAERDYGNAPPPAPSPVPPPARDVGPAAQPEPFYAPAQPRAPIVPQAGARGPVGGTLGVTAVFFPRPMLRNMDVSAARVDAADRFCQAQGFSFALYFDRGPASGRAVDAGGRMVGPGPVLRDVLCRRF